jgi:hypothetical protein
LQTPAEGFYAPEGLLRPLVVLMMGMYRFAYEPEVHITRYAATHPSKDFAEVLGVWVKYGGRIPGRWETPGIVRK